MERMVLEQLLHPIDVSAKAHPRPMREAALARAQPSGMIGQRPDLAAPRARRRHVLAGVEVEVEREHALLGGQPQPREAPQQLGRHIVALKSCSCRGHRLAHRALGVSA
jgi:hypothetical protein